MKNKIETSPALKKALRALTEKIASEKPEIQPEMHSMLAAKQLVKERPELFNQLNTGDMLIAKMASND